MPLLAGVNISKQYGADVILSGVSLSIEPGERIGLVGRNGEGKSTLLKVLAGLLPADAGDVSIQKGRRAGYLRQDPEFDPEESVRDAAESAFAELHDLHRQQHRLYEQIAAAQSGGDDEAVQRLLRRQADLEHRVEAAGGYAIDHLVGATLHGVGLTDAEFPLPTRALSGGQRGRLALARLLLEKPDLLLLDEPTNHLDIVGRLWLEDFLLREFRGAAVIVSHDRRLLEHVVTRIIEVEQARLIDYPGGYGSFLEIRAQRRLTQARAWEKQQTRFKSEEAFIRRYKAGQRAKQARGRETRLERAKRDETLERPMEVGTFRMELPKASRSGDIVIAARGISKRYTGEDGRVRTLFSEFDATIGRGERWGIIGPNGAGKTTLVRTLLGEIAPDEGTVRLGSNVIVGHYTQTDDVGDPDDIVYRRLQRAIQKERPGAEWSEQQARDLAGAFLFSGDEQEKAVGVLSGGERSRLRLAALLASAKNLLILDEPTNHLDIPSAERLEDALEAAGEEVTLLLISHDRAILDAVCDRLVVLDGAGNARVFLGSYSEWREKELAEQAERDAVEAQEREARDARDRAAKQAAPPPPPPPKGEPARDGLSNAERLRLRALEAMTVAQLEAKIESIESRLREIDRTLAGADVWREPSKAEALGAERESLARELEPLEFEWSRRIDAM